MMMNLLKLSAEIVEETSTQSVEELVHVQEEVLEEKNIYRNNNRNKRTS